MLEENIEALSDEDARKVVGGYSYKDRLSSGERSTLCSAIDNVNVSSDIKSMAKLTVNTSGGDFITLSRYFYALTDQNYHAWIDIYLLLHELAKVE